MAYAWPHTRAAWNRFKSAWAYILVRWALRLDSREVWLVYFERRINNAYQRKLNQGEDRCA